MRCICRLVTAQIHPPPSHPFFSRLQLLYVSLLLGVTSSSSSRRNELSRGGGLAEVPEKAGQKAAGGCWVGRCWKMTGALLGWTLFTALGSLDKMLSRGMGRSVSINHTVFHTVYDSGHWSTRLSFYAARLRSPLSGVKK